VLARHRPICQSESGAGRAADDDLFPFHIVLEAAPIGGHHA
jgi:hypothetical protein